MYTENGKDYLEHHGILGMKWGIRRYQNKDGSLTNAGKKRVQKLRNEYNEITGKKLIRTKSKDETPKEEKIKEVDLDKKPIRKMTDEELNTRINRLSTEKRAKDLEAEMRTSNGKKFVSNFGKSVLAPAAIEAGRNAFTKLFYKYAEEALGLTAEDRNNARQAYNMLKDETEIAELKKRKFIAERDLNGMIAEEKEKKQKKSNPGYTISRESSLNGKKFIQNGNNFIEYNKEANSAAVRSSKKKGASWLKKVHNDVW